MRGRLGIGFAALTMVVAGCAAKAAEAGPLGERGGHAGLCTTEPGQSPVVFGNEVLRNSGSRVVTVNAVRLVGAHGLALDEAFLVPIEKRTLLGFNALPPTADVWSERQPAAGARIASGETLNLALALSRSDDRAGFADVEVAYSAGDDSYRLRLAHELLVLSHGACD